MSRTPEQFHGTSVDPPNFGTKLPQLKKNVATRTKAQSPSNTPVNFITNNVTEHVTTQGYAKDRGTIHVEQQSSSINSTSGEESGRNQQQSSSGSSPADSATNAGGSRNVTMNFGPVNCEEFTAYREN